MCRSLGWSVLLGVVWAAQAHGHRTRFGPTLVGLGFPVLLVWARVLHRRHWRVAVSSWLAPAILLNSFHLFGLLYIGPPYSEDALAKVVALLEVLAEYLLANSITTSVGLLTLLCAFRPQFRRAETRAFFIATASVVTAVSSITVAMFFGSLAATTVH